MELNMNYQNYVFISTHMQQWSGKTALSFDSELGVSNNDSVFQGTKSICPTVLLRPFGAIERALSKEMDRIGVRFLSPTIWAIPMERLAEADAVLVRIRERFEAALWDFSYRYDHEFEMFVSGKENESLLRHSKLPLEEVKRRYVFSTARFQMADSEHNQGIGRDALYDAFTNSIAKQGRELFEQWEARTFKNVLPARSLNGLRMLRDKVNGFIALSPNAYALVEHIDEVLESFPSGTHLEGVHIINAYALVCLLKDESTLKGFSDLLIRQKRAEAESLNAGRDIAAEDSDLPGSDEDFADPGDFDLEGAVNIKVLPKQSQTIDSIPVASIPLAAASEEDSDSSVQDIPLAEETDEGAPSNEEIPLAEEIPVEGSVTEGLPENAPF
jgi:hypothetical protein